MRITPESKDTKSDTGATQAAKDLLEASEHGGREGRYVRRVIAVVAALWSLFQLALPQFLLLNSAISRSVHLGFAILLVYLSFPLMKKSVFLGEGGKSASKGIGLWWQKCVAKLSSQRLGVLDVLLALMASGCALYLAWDYEGIGQRSGLPIMRDVLVSCVLVVLLLEAARRCLGPTLPLIAGVFIGYSFVSESMPHVIAFKNASLDTMISKLVMSTEGIYGVPLDVSTSTVFLFVLFGALLDKSGGGKYFIDMAFSLLGKYQGGPAKAAVLASGLTGMVSGSSIANTVTTGTFTIPLMKKSGFPAHKAAAIEVASSTNGQLMPPIMGAAAFIIAEYCNMNYLMVVKTAIVPALVSYVALIYIAHLESKKMNLRRIPAAELPRFWPTFWSGVHFLLPLAFLFVQMVVFRRSAAFSVYYAFLCLAALVVLKSVRESLQKNNAWHEGVARAGVQLWHSLVAGAQNMMSIGVAVAAAGIIVGVVTLGLGGAVVDLIDVMSGGNLVLMLLITAAVSLVLGMGLPTTANYIVMASLTAPAIVALSGDMGLVVPLVAAHLFCFYFGILADDTPPVGLAAYAAGAIAREDPIKVGVQGFTYDMRTAILPFMFIFNTDLLLIGVNSVPQAVWIFLCALVAMFSFASVLQGFLSRRLMMWERVLLGLVVLVLFRPQLAVEHLGGEVLLWQVLGLAIYAAIYAYNLKANPNTLRC